MYNNNRNESRAAWGFMAVFAIVLAMGLGLLAFSAEAAPFAYVTNAGDNTVSVIDTATNPPSVVATVPVGSNPGEVAVAPDGKYAYVVDTLASRVSVIDTATNKVVGTPDPGGAYSQRDRHHPGRDTRLRHGD
jgi:YVTN family beta-propeller protein